MMKTEAQILAEVNRMTRDEIEERIRTLRAVANTIATSGSPFAFMADEKLYEISILEAYLKGKVRY